MNEHQIVRSLLLRMGRGIRPTASVATAIVQWAESHTEWLSGQSPQAEPFADAAALLSAVAGWEAPAEPQPHVLRMADTLADLLALDAFDRNLLTVMVAGDRLQRPARLLDIAAREGWDLPSLLGEIAGAEPGDAERAVRRSPVLRLGLVGFYLNRQGLVEVEMRWALERLFERAPESGEEMIDALVGTRQGAPLDLADFAHVAQAELIVRLLSGAVRDRASGINILIHGPPGTGKTELARTIAAAAGVELRGVGEAADTFEEPTRRDRLDALHLAQRLLERNGGAALLFDEMEDLIGNSERGAGDWFAKREGSKLFVNRLLETNAVPVIWTTNAIGNIDEAILRRMSFVLKMGLPSRGAALRILDRVARDEGVVPAQGFAQLIERAPESAMVLRVATRAARLAGEADGGMAIAGGLARALRGGALPDGPPGGELDLDLFEADRPLPPLLAAIARGAATDVSLLLTGAPGTGKTAFAHHLARALDRPLAIKRASDLLSRWVGGTEAAIADAFAEAREQESILLFDEVDSLLFDRSGATHNWEAGQVNEMLTWLDRHPLPVIAATNHAHRLDPAALRRFVFKIDLAPLSAARAARAFRHFFAEAPPRDLADVVGLTPGDFENVARQLRSDPAGSPAEIVARLSRETAWRTERATMGF